MKIISDAKVCFLVNWQNILAKFSLVVIKS